MSNISEWFKKYWQNIFTSAMGRRRQNEQPNLQNNVYWSHAFDVILVSSTKNICNCMQCTFRHFLNRLDMFLLFLCFFLRLHLFAKTELLPSLLHCIVKTRFFLIFLTFSSIVFPFFVVKKTFCCDHNSALPPLCLWQTNHYTSLLAGTSLQAHLEPWAQPPIISS